MKHWKDGSRTGSLLGLKFRQKDVLIENGTSRIPLYNINRRLMSSNKKKSELTAVLDDLRCDDPKKRLAAVREVKEVAAVLGPSRVKS